MAERRIRANTARALTLLKGGVVGGHVGALLVVGVFWIARGPRGGLSAAVAAAVTLAFYVIGQAVQVVVAEARPRNVLLAALGSYALRVGVLGAALAFVVARPDEFAGVDAVAVVVATIVVVISWLAAEIWTFSRLRIPVFDPPDEI